MKKTDSKDHWDDHAKQWHRIASPLRPCGEDIKIIQQIAGITCGRCLILGATPEFAGLSARLFAIDHNEAMIRSVWPGGRAGLNAAQGNWLRMPFKSCFFDAIIGDGCLTLLTWPDSYRGLFDNLRRVVKPEGIVALRAFVAPDGGETCEKVCREALEGKIGSFHAFKWRFAMAMVYEAGQPNIGVAEIYDNFNRLLPDRQHLAAHALWADEDIATIDVYSGSSAIYSFPTLSQMRRTFQGSFTEINLMYGIYELSELCPIVVLRPAK